MPKFTRFYSATEAEALANISRLFPRWTERASQFNNSDAEQLSDTLNGNVVFLPRSRNDINQPIISQSPSAQHVEQLLNLSDFNISHDTVHRNKIVRYASSSEDSTEWKTRSRTPSSDEPSSSPISTVKADTSSTSDALLEDDLAYTAAPRLQKREFNWGLYPDHYATYPEDVLRGMDTQFSKFSYDLTEGCTAIPFVMAQAPEETHAQLVAIDRMLWKAGDSYAVEDTADNDTATAAVLKRFQKTDRQRAIKTKRTAQANDGSSGNGNASHDNKLTSKRAALIARSRATKHGPLVVSSSANQRRSVMHKNKNRKSIMPSPPPTVRRHEQRPKPEPPAEQKRPTILILKDDQRRDVDSALQDKRLDLDNTQQLQELMKKLGKAMTEEDEASEGRVVEENGVDASHGNTSIADIWKEVGSDGNIADQAGKEHRLKGKARKNAKRRVAR